MAARGLTLLLLLAGCAVAPLDGWAPQDGPTFRLQTTLRPLLWSGEVTWVDDGLTAQPGGAWALDYALDADLRLHQGKFGAFEELVVAVQAVRRHDAEGRWQAGFGTVAVSNRLTTSGVPVERFNGWPTLTALHGRDGTPFEAVARHPIAGDVAAVHELSGRLTVELPPETPIGWYEPRVTVWVQVQGQKEPVLLDNFGDNSNTQDEQILPLVKVGEPAIPRLPVVLGTDKPYRGQLGVLSEQDRATHGLVGRAGFPKRYVIMPGRWEMGPGFPSLFPERFVAPVDGGFDVIPAEIRHYLEADTMQVRMELDGQPVEPLTRHERVPDDVDPEDLPPPGPHFGARPGGFALNLGETGEHRVMLDGYVFDRFGRRFAFGGDYTVWTAMPLSFSTSVKPGTPFLVGEGYPAKANVNPAFPADVDVVIDWYPNSDRERHVRWESHGVANRFGHYFPYDTPGLVFDEPGEYVSHITAKYTDANGVLWMGDQTSANVVAPADPAIHLHGTRSPPHNLKPKQEWMGATQRFDGRVDARAAFLPFKPGQIPDTFAPYRVEDTLLVQANGFKENIIEPHLSVSIDEPGLRQRVRDGNTKGTVLPPPTLQLDGGDWDYLTDVVQISADSAAWFPADEQHADELPIAPAGDGRWHPFNFPEGNQVDAYTYLGVVRPGFPVLTSVFETDAIGLYWLASPNRFGYHYNTSANGDLIGDIYRIQAGAVIKDRVTGQNHYDAYGASIVVVPDDGASTAIAAPIDKVLVQTSDRQHRVFVGQDSHDALEVGETIFLGGMTAPAVVTEVEWTVTKPSGAEVTVLGTASRLGIVRGKPGVFVDEPGVWKIHTKMPWKGEVGDTIGTADGTFFHFAVPTDAPALLESPVGAVEAIAADGQAEIPLSWPADIEDATVWFGVLMPGRVLDQGSFVPPENAWTYRFTPQQFSVQAPNLDARNYGTGEWELADTVVLQFFLEGTRNGEPVHDALRLALRGDVLYNYAALLDGYVPPEGAAERAAAQERSGRKGGGYGAGGHRGLGPGGYPRGD